MTDPYGQAPVSISSKWQWDKGSAGKSSMHNSDRPRPSPDKFRQGTKVDDGNVPYGWRRNESVEVPEDHSNRAERQLSSIKNSREFAENHSNRWYDRGEFAENVSGVSRSKFLCYDPRELNDEANFLAFDIWGSLERQKLQNANAHDHTQRSMHYEEDRSLHHIQSKQGVHRAPTHTHDSTDFRQSPDMNHQTHIRNQVHDHQPDSYRDMSHSSAQFSSESLRRNSRDTWKHERDQRDDRDDRTNGDTRSSVRNNRRSEQRSDQESENVRENSASSKRSRWSYGPPEADVRRDIDARTHSTQQNPPTFSDNRHVPQFDRPLNGNQLLPGFTPILPPGPSQNRQDYQVSSPSEQGRDSLAGLNVNYLSDVLKGISTALASSPSPVEPQPPMQFHPTHLHPQPAQTQQLQMHIPTQAQYAQVLSVPVPVHPNLFGIPVTTQMPLPQNATIFVHPFQHQQLLHAPQLHPNSYIIPPVPQTLPTPGNSIPSTQIEPSPIQSRQEPTTIITVSDDDEKKQEKQSPLKVAVVDLTRDPRQPRDPRVRPPPKPPTSTSTSSTESKVLLTSSTEGKTLPPKSSNTLQVEQSRTQSRSSLWRKR